MFRFTAELHGSMMVCSPGIGNRTGKTVDTVQRLAARFSTTKTVDRLAFESPAFSYKCPNLLAPIDVTRCDRVRPTPGFLSAISANLCEPEELKIALSIVDVLKWYVRVDWACMDRMQDRK